MKISLEKTFKIEDRYLKTSFLKKLLLIEEFMLQVFLFNKEFLDPESGSELEEDIEFVDKYDKDGKKIVEPIKYF